MIDEDQAGARRLEDMAARCDPDVAPLIGHDHEIVGLASEQGVAVVAQPVPLPERDRHVRDGLAGLRQHQGDVHRRHVGAGQGERGHDAGGMPRLVHDRHHAVPFGHARHRRGKRRVRQDGRLRHGDMPEGRRNPRQQDRSRLLEPAQGEERLLAGLPARAAVTPSWPVACRYQAYPSAAAIASVSGRWCPITYVLFVSQRSFAIGGIICKRLL